MIPEAITSEPSPIETSELDRILDEAGRGPGDVIPVLQAIQARYHYLPESALRYVCDHSAITPAAIVGVSTFYTQFRHTPAGKHRVSVCVGTACHVKGADRIIDALRRHLKLEGDADTDTDKLFTIQPVNCLGCCTLAPVVQVDDVIYGYATTENVGELLNDFLQRGSSRRQDASNALPAGQILGDIRVAMGSCCVASGAAAIETALYDRIRQLHAPVRVQRVGCMGLCYEEPLIEIVPPRGTPTLYTQVKPEDVPVILHQHFPAQRRRERLTHAVRHWLEQVYTDAAWTGPRRFDGEVRDPQIASFLDAQNHIATEYSGQIDPLNLDAYRDAGGMDGFRKALRELDPGSVIDCIQESGLRGRGGGGYPTGRKWREVARANNAVKYVICNGDEGDPGAFMDRMLLESYPYRVIEGILIAGYAVGATEGVLYIRSEYPLAIERVREAIAFCRRTGWLGQNILDSGFSFDLDIMVGAGAFVCGEETALIAAIEGRRGMPRMRPPYPAQKGLHGRPTLVNNTETFAMVPWILRHGAAAFSAIGTESSKGTKVFALAGKIRRGGMIEVPMGITIRQVINEIGGGIADDRPLKAVQIGGPSGGCIPERLADIPIDFEALVGAGAMMGSGGLVALDDTDCMVEIARYFLAFTQDESCGKCTFCRIGTQRLLEILERLCAGKAKPDDIENLERLAAQVKQGSLCGLGRTAPNPALTTLRYFREEYEAHLNGICPAGQCKALIRYHVTEDCIGCTRCAQRCPADAIEPQPYERHEINPELCVRCDACRQACPNHAIIVMSGNHVVRPAATPNAETVQP